MNFHFAKEEEGIFTPDISTRKPDILLPNLPVRDYLAYIRPGEDAAARKRGDALREELQASREGVFEKDEAWSACHPGEVPDRMVHVSTTYVAEGVLFVTYYAAPNTDAEDPTHQEARLSVCPVGKPEKREIYTLMKVGDFLDGRKIDRVYDTILLPKGDQELFLLWTASADGIYYRFYRILNLKTREIGATRPNRFKVGNITNDFSAPGMIAALAENEIPRKGFFSDIGLMQNPTFRWENGEKWYYTGAYSGYFNCLVKSRDLITWEYVSAPDFDNFSLWENAVTVRGDRVWYFSRQDDCLQGFLTCYDRGKKSWSRPILVQDTQSRSDFIEWKGKLYLIHAPLNREGFGILEINEDCPEKSRVVLVCDMQESFFYPYARVEGDRVALSWTDNRKHIRLSSFDADKFLS